MDSPPNEGMVGHHRNMHDPGRNNKVVLDSDLNLPSRIIAYIFVQSGSRYIAAAVSQYRQKQQSMLMMIGDATQQHEHVDQRRGVHSRDGASQQHSKHQQQWVRFQSLGT